MKQAVEMSKIGWPNGANCVLIASGEDYADALSAAPLAKLKDSPIVLTKKSGLNEETLQEIKRLNPSNIYIIGGEGVVSKEIDRSLKNNLNLDTERIYGVDRYETSIKIAERLGKLEEVFIVSGENYADALSVAGIAAMKKSPVILTEKNKLPSCSREYLNKNYNNLNKIYFVGGVDSISNNIESQFTNSKRLGGIDRYETNREILKNFQGELDFKKIYMAKGDGFADALSASVIAAKGRAPVFLVDNSTNNPLRDFGKFKIASNNVVTVLGGNLNIPDSKLDSMKIIAEILEDSGEFYNKDIYNNVDIIGKNIILKNSRIRGDLYIDSSDISLYNVVVDGIIYINSGAGNSVILSNVSSRDTVIISGNVQNEGNNGVREKSHNDRDGNSKVSNAFSKDHNDSKDSTNNSSNGGKQESKKDDTNTGDENLYGGYGDNNNSTTPAAIDIIDIKLDKDNLDMLVGDELKLDYKIIPENASNKNIIWYCDNKDVLELSEEGVVRAKNPGEAKVVIAADNGLKSECTVKVRKKVETEGLRECKDITKVKNILDSNTLNINLERYNNLSNNAKHIVAASIYENKDVFEYKSEIQEYIDTLLTKGYKINDNTATLIEGIEGNLNNAVEDSQISNIFMPSGVYVVGNTLNINRDIKIAGEERESTKIQLSFPRDSTETKVGLAVSEKGKLDLSNLSIDGLYNNGNYITYAVQSYGNLALDKVNIQNVGEHLKGYGYGIGVNGGILSADNCAFSNIKGTAIVSNYYANLYIGMNGGNIFEGNSSDDQVSAISTRNDGQIFIMNNRITGYKKSQSSGLKLNNGGVYTVKNNIITDNYIGIKAAPRIAVNLDIKGSTEEVLSAENPECKGNQWGNVQIMK